MIQKAILLILSFSILACAHRELPPGAESGIDNSFYEDNFDLSALIDEDEDPPNRKAALRLIAEVWPKAAAGNNKDCASWSRDLEAALGIDPQNPYAFYFLSRVALKCEQLEKAIVFAKKAETFFRDNPVWESKALVLQAKAHLGLYQKGPALDRYEQAAHLDPFNPAIQEGLQKIQQMK